MSEPEKKPAKVEPAIESNETPVTESPESEIKSAPAAANSNDEQHEPAVGVTLGDTNAKKEPVVVPVVPAVQPATPEAPETPEAPAANDDQPAAETPAVEAPAAETLATDAPAAAAEGAATDAPAATETAAALPPKPSRAKGFLKGAFNFVASAAVSAASSYAIKATIGASLLASGVPVWTTLLATSLVIGAAATLIADAKHRHGQKKEGKELSKYFSRAHGKELLSKRNLTTFGISTAGAILGGAIALGFQEGVIQNAWHNFWGGNPAPLPVETAVIPPVVAPVETAVLPPVETAVLPPVETAVVPPVETVIAPPVEAVVPAVVPCVTPVEQFTQLIDGHQVSAQVADAMTRAASTNAHVAAQGTKDLAYYAFNGFDGVPKDAHVANELFRQAAEAGNNQARVDLVYEQFYGKGGVTADPKAALATMKSLPGARAHHFVAEWTKALGKGASGIAAAPFEADTILKGTGIVACPAI